LHGEIIFDSDSQRNLTFTEGKPDNFGLVDISGTKSSDTTILFKWLGPTKKALQLEQDLFLGPIYILNAGKAPKTVLFKYVGGEDEPKHTYHADTDILEIVNDGNKVTWDEVQSLLLT
jgi:hypothetical protein